MHRAFPQSSLLTQENVGVSIYLGDEFDGILTYTSTLSLRVRPSASSRMCRTISLVLSLRTPCNATGIEFRSRIPPSCLRYKSGIIAHTTSYNDLPLESRLDLHIIGIFWYRDAA